MIPAFLRGNPFESHDFLPFKYPCLNREQAEAVWEHLAGLIRGRSLPFTVSVDDPTNVVRAWRNDDRPD